MTRRVWAFDFLSGDFLTEVPVSSCSWAMKHRASGTIDAVLTWPSLPDHAAADLFNALDPWRRGLAVVEESPHTGQSYVLQAGPIYSHDDDDASGRLTVRAAGIESYLAARMLFTAASIQSPQLWSQVLEDVTLGDIAIEYVTIMLGHTNGDPPIIVPSQVGGTRTKTIKGSDLASVWGRIVDIMNRQDGPDVVFEPRVRSDNLGVEWVMRVGTESDPFVAQSGADHAWRANVIKPTLSDMTTNRNAAERATRMYAIGSGLDTQLRQGRAFSDLLDAGYPALDRKVDHQSVQSWNELAEHASAALAAVEYPQLQIGFSVRAATRPYLGTYRPGHWATVDVKRRRSDGTLRYAGLLFPTGTVHGRLTEVSGDLTDAVRVAVLPERTAR